MRIPPPACSRTQAAWQGASQQREITCGKGTALVKIRRASVEVSPARRREQLLGASTCTGHVVTQAGGWFWMHCSSS